MRPIPVLLLLGLLPFAAARAAEPENAKPAEKPIDREEVQRLASQLDAEDPADREKTTEALCNLGPGVVPFLLPALEKAGPEQAMRIKTVGHHWGYYLAKEPPAVNERLMALQETDGDIEKRIQAFDAIFSTGESGCQLLQALFDARGARPAIEFALDREVVIAGGRIIGRAYLSNLGSDPFWTYQDEFITIDCISDPTLFGEVRPGGRRRLAMRGGGGRALAEVHLARYLRLVRKGGTGPSCPVDVELKKVGKYRLKVSAQNPGQSLEHYVDGEPKYRFVINREHLDDREFRYPSGTIDLFALPDLDRITSDDRLALALTQDKAPADEEKAVEATVTLRSKDNEKPVYLEQNLARYAWYAVLDEKGTPVKWGSWHSASEDQDAALKARKVEPQGKASWKLRIPAAGLKPGTYQIIASYKAEPYLPPIASGECMLWGDFGDELKEAKLDSVIRYESGELGAKAAQTFTIPAKEESEAKKP